MEAAGRGFRLATAVVLLVHQLHQEADSASLCIVPNKLQFFQRESVVFHCEESCGSVGLSSDSSQPCKDKSVPPGSSCSIQTLYEEDSGPYRCGGQQRSINITVTGGLVVLESPAQPVSEGDSVTLTCRSFNSSSGGIASFYRHDRLLANTIAGSFSILHVSKADEGWFKCRVSGGAESAESWLSVTEAEASPLFSTDGLMWILILLLILLLLKHVVTFIWRCLQRGGPGNVQTSPRAARPENGDLISAYATYSTYSTASLPQRSPSPVAQIYCLAQDPAPRQQ